MAEPESEVDAESSVEHRLIGQLLDLWRALDGHTAPPPLSRIDETALGEIWHWCYVLDLPAGGAPTAGGAAIASEPRVSRAGREIVRQAGRETLEGPLSTLPPASLVAQSVQAWRQVVARRVPVATGGAFDDADGRQIRYRSVLLPLSEDGKSICQLLGAANGRVMVDE